MAKEITCFSIFKTIPFGVGSTSIFVPRFHQAHFQHHWSKLMPQACRITKAFWNPLYLAPYSSILVLSIDYPSPYTHGSFLVLWCEVTIICSPILPKNLGIQKLFISDFQTSNEQSSHFPLSYGSFASDHYVILLTL
ncbi:hypothetical protein EYC84_008374 [Monilinia fructicola]|uniref:Uncharacterized protein n=1 Tax=Monilinia fructicola TaxID=38448 RepID=A0A5M9JGP8_MONFR|nr:hypothetical protein EYC84_008374 [Monilinia fructicola]